jgi:hypothetical protein
MFQRGGKKKEGNDQEILLLPFHKNKKPFQRPPLL